MPSPCTVTCQLQTAADVNLQGNAFVRFLLRNFAGFVPRVDGVGIIAEPQIDVFPNVSGAISTALWGNDVIDPTNTFYTVEWWNGGRVTSRANFLITGTNFDLDVAAQINPPPQPGTSGLTPLLLETNGVKNGSQIKQNLVAGSGITLSDDGVGDITLSGQGATISTSGQGYFLGPGILGPVDSSESSTDLLTDVANRVYVTQFVLPVQITVRKVSWYVNGLTNGVHFNFGIYSGDGNTKLIDAAFTVSNIGNAQSVTLAAPVTLPPGVYWLAQTDDAASTSGPGLLAVLSASVWVKNFNANNPHWGYAANAASGGVLPGTLGAITTPIPGPNTVVIAVPLFEP